MQYKAAVLRRAGAPLTLETLNLPGPRGNEVLVRMASASVCHTDYEAATGAFAAALPVVLGHEGAGVVEAVGAGVRNLKPGDHVVCNIYPACGGCFYCRRSQSMLCDAMATPGPASDSDGRPVHAFLNVSAFAEMALLPQSGVVRIDPAMPLECACLLGCAVITGIGAVQRIAKVGMGDSVAVVGCGAVGLNVIQGARLAGAACIVAIDRNPAKLARAVAFGATDALEPQEPGHAAEVVRSLTGGRGVDHGFEAAGIRGSLQTTLDCTRAGGNVVILGKMDPDASVELRFGSLMGERRIVRSSLGGARAADDFPSYVTAYLKGRLLLDQQIDARLPLSAVNEALDATGRGDVVRALVSLNG